MDQLPRLGKRELICLLSFTCNYVVFVWRSFLFLWVLGMGYVILLWHSLSLPYNYFDTMKKQEKDHRYNVLCDRWRSLVCQPTQLEIRSNRRSSVEPWWTKQQTKELRFQPAKINSFRSGNIESDARSTGVQLKSAAKLSTLIGLITKHADCRMPILLRCLIIFRN